MTLSKSGLLSFAFFLAVNLVVLHSARGQMMLLKDVNTGQQQHTLGSYPALLTPCNNLVFFAASDSAHGVELWKSDGSPGGTQLVKEIATGPAGAAVSDLADVNGTLYFSASDGINGKELWKSDGTEAGTVMIDIIPGSFHSSPMSITNVNGTIYFTAQDPEHGRELWKSNGTPEGTVMVKDIATGTGSGFSPFLGTALVSVGSTIFFTADDGVHGRELWKSDGTESGTVMVKDINPGIGSAAPIDLIGIGDRLYFISNDGVHGQELWVSDGTESGTYILKDIAPGAASAGASRVFALQGGVFFRATYDGLRLWSTDGTEAGTVPVTGTLPALVGIHYGPGREVNDRLYFTAGDQELWVTDGTDAGTVFVKQFESGTPTQLIGDDGITLYLSVVSQDTQQELWKTDGTGAGTVLVKDINPDRSSSPASLVTAGGKILFVADDGVHDNELWVTDGTSGGTMLVKDINTRLKYFASDFRAVGNSLFFVNHRSESTYEVWNSDGTPEGTTLVRDINPGDVSFAGGGLTGSANKLYMALDDGVHGFELWVSDGTANGTTLLKDIRTGPEGSNPTLNAYAFLNGTLFFQADDGINGPALWKTDGTEAGTVMVTPVNAKGSPYIDSMHEAGGVLYFVTSFELWRTDGTDAGTSLVKEINPTYNGSNPYSLYSVNDVLYFIASDGTHGNELWRSDGTESGTYLVKDIHQGDDPHFIDIIGHVAGKLILRAAASGFEYELWISDGTEEGTALLKNINSVQGSSPRVLAQNDHFVYFAADDGEHGTELWKTDGTPEGTVMIRDLFPGASASQPTNGVVYKGKLYFAANDGVHGEELWGTDGTPEGTALVADINPGAASSYLSNLTAVSNNLFFSADDGVHGREPWKLQAFPQTITFDALADREATDSFALSASASSGLPVDFAVVSGPASISGNTVVFSGAGQVTIRASQEGDLTTEPATPVERSFQVVKAAQIISFPALSAKKSTDPPFDVSATSSSGLPVTFSVVAGSATIVESTITITGAGEVSVKASQSGNEIYAAAEDVVQSFSVELIVGVGLSETDAIKVYPNPATDALFVRMARNFQGGSVELLNSRGQKAWETVALPGENEFVIPVKNLPPGLYVLQSGQRGQKFLRKVIVR